jgi:putative membrane protein
MSRLAKWMALLGLALATGLILREGFGAVFEALSVAGAGLFWASLFHVVPMALNARGFELLLPRAPGRSFRFFAWLVWVREAVDSLLPVVRVGGALASARLMIGRGIRTELAVGSLVADTTVSLVTQFLFVLLGVALLALRAGGHPIVVRLALGCLAGVPVVLAFVFLQRLGPFDLGARALKLLFGDRLGSLAQGPRLDRALKRLYSRRRALFWSSLFQMAGWISGAGEIWLVLFFLGHPLPVAVSLILHALTQAVSSAFFVVPGALGVQEAGFLLLAPVFGLSGDVGLALALARRVRDVIVFVPGLLLWQLSEVQTARGVRP